MILGIVLSISAAFCWSIGAMLTRLGLKSGMATSTATLISTLGSLPLLTALALSVNFDDLVKLSPLAILWFVIVGIVNYVMARQFSFISIKHIGVTKATPLFSSSPVFAMTLAVVFLGESISTVIVLGALSILGGIYLVVTSQ